MHILTLYIYILYIPVYLPSGIRHDRAERQRRADQEAGQHIRVAHGTDVPQAVGDKQVGGVAAARGHGSTVHVGQPCVKLAETGAEQRDGRPLVQRGPAQRQQVDGPGHRGQVGRDEQLDRHGRGHDEHGDEDHGLVRVVRDHRGPRPAGPWEQAQQLAHSERRVQATGGHRRVSVSNDCR